MPKTLIKTLIAAAIFATVAFAVQKKLRNPLKDFDFVLIRAGSFTMGCANVPKFPCDSDELPVHQVTLTRDFWLQSTPVTQKQWTQLMGTNPSSEQCPECPVDNLSWFDTQEFIKKLAKLDKNYRYRLPSEAEWEYADRAGTRTVFPWGNEAEIQGKRIPFPNLTPVKTFPANAWGLYAMNGTVWQWVQDWYAPEYRADAQIDPQGPSTGHNRVARGGTVRHESRHSSASSRHADYPDIKTGTGCMGFRLVREKLNAR